MKLKFNIHNKVGRNRGRISSYHRGGGTKKLYRVVDFWRYLVDLEGRVVSIEKDPYRSSNIALVCFSNARNELANTSSTPGRILKEITTTLAFRDFVIPARPHVMPPP